MGVFDDLLRQGAPEPEVSIYLPGKVGTVDKGGDATQAAAAPAGKPSDSQGSSTAPEPEPQLPEGSDPDDPDTADDDAADAAEAAAAAREMFKVEPAVEAVSAEAGGGQAGDGQDAPEDDDDTVHSADRADVGSKRRAVANRKGSGLSFEGEHSHLKQFPKALIEILRDVLKPHLGDVATRELSQNTVVTAFVVASLGVDFSADDNTLDAVQAFKAADPRTDAIEKRTVSLLEQQTRFEKMMKALLARVGELAETSAVLEIGQAYALAERTAQLDSETASAPPEKLDVTQKRVIATRDNIRNRVKVQRQDEKIRDGRPIR